ncbi:DUF550 domain-containing protein [Citrobacter portucalensis]|uniref:DUF550 domain-containing protein n=1 Tax=Citrobacter portucalensis TaxID=1639133 RepID=UPI003075DBD0
MTTNNHPANGPVSLERLHQIRETLSKAAAQSDGGNIGYAMADAVKVIDGAIARELVRRDHAAWSLTTFGDVGPVGPLKHLSKEALEAAAEPGDLSEWADMQFLLWDAQRRAGISDGEITAAMEEKLKVNIARQWPEPKDGEPRLHIKEQPAPVVPDEKPMPEASKMHAIDAVAAIAEVKGWNACRAAMLHAGNHTEQHLDMVVHYGDDNEKADCRLPFDQWLSQQNEPIDVDCGCVTTEAFYHWLRVAYEAGNSPVTPDGWQLVPKEPTEAMNKAGWAAINEHDAINPTYRAMLAAAPQQDVRLALEIGMSRYAGAMQKLVDSGD